MTDTPETTAQNAPQENQETGLTSDYIHEIREALASRNAPRVQGLTEDFHASDTAELLAIVSRPEREQLIRALDDDFDPETLTYLDDAVREDVIGILGTERTAEALARLETDDAVQVMEYLELPAQQELLQAIDDASTRAELSEGLAYPEESAGRLMQKRFVAVPEYWMVGNVIDFLRESNEELPEEFYEIILVDPRHHPVGTVMVSRIMQNQRDVAIRALMKDDLYPVATTMDQEEVAHLFRRYALVETPVVNREGRVVGVITVDDIVDVITEEEEEDYLRAGGIIDRDLNAGLLDTVKRRLPWLTVNLATASLAAGVIAQFEATIAQWVTLAVLMPIIASSGGNAGIQSVTVAVRAIAMRELQSHNAWPVIRKEMFTNFLNGLVLSAMMAVAIVLIYRDVHLAGIFALATVGTLTCAGLSGTLIPLLLNRYKIDPAIASGVFLTTLTDVLSFASFLGLATWLLR